MEWFYALEGAQHGPVSEAEIKTMIGTGKIAGADFVWHEGMTDWKPVSETPELMTPQPSTTATAPAEVADGSSSDAAWPYQPPAAELGQVDLAPADFIGYAGFGQRLVALIIDSLVTGVLGAVVGVILGVIAVAAETEDSALTEVVYNLIGVLIGWLYYVLMESSSKQATLGKMAMGIKVTDLNGNRIGFGRATGRYFAKIISSLILLIGYLMMLWSPRKQTLHDSISGCLVTRSR